MSLVIVTQEKRGSWQSVLLDDDKPYPNNFLCGIWDRDKGIALAYTHAHAQTIEVNRKIREREEHGTT